MRFVLDHDVDAGVVGVLVRKGHEAWVAPAVIAGDEPPQDDIISVYADDKNATVITHDYEFTARRRKNTFGKHVHLKCSQPDAIDVVTEKHDELIVALNTHAEVVVEVSHDEVKPHPPQWQ